MFENQPKGLFALALANTGERFGYYTMLAIFTLFMQAKFGYNEGQAAGIYSAFLAGVYFLPLIGGMLADKFGFGKCVISGFIVMFIGYLLLSVPSAADTVGYWMMIGALTLIAIGTGLFKGNLQVMVGNLYDDPRYSKKRDTAFSLFYMAINIGAMFAPTAATAVTNWMMGKDGFIYDGRVPAIAHQIMDGTASEANRTLLQGLIDHHAIATNFSGDLLTFSKEYVVSLSQAYNYGFAIACISLVVSALIYFIFRKTFKHVEGQNKTTTSTEKSDKAVEVETISPAESKQRVTALILVFIVVIFFWMAFHQNGLTLTYFARDYTASTVTGLSRLGFNVWNLSLIAIFIYAMFSFFQSKTRKGKTIGGVIAAFCVMGLLSIYVEMDQTLTILPQQFQQFNPFFVVALTPFSLLLFSSLAAKGKEPSAPRKIAFGMLVAALAYCLLSFGSFGMPTPAELKTDANLLTSPASPNLLIGTYLVLTFAELLLSPMGISFVSKVAPPKLKGLMMGGWFAATAVGNYAVQITGRLWGNLPLVVIWSILIVLCLLAALFMFTMMKRLEKVS
ncbi:MAG: peptide MFS transporter [Prevotella sp.]